MKKIDEIMHYSYGEMETFGQLLIGLPGICHIKDICGLSSAEVIQRLIDIAVDFTKEWDKVSNEEHDVLGEDYLEEVNKLADWIKKHAYDVFNNSLEYGGYRARVQLYAIVEDCDTRPIDRYEDEEFYESKSDAIKAMLEMAAERVAECSKSSIQYVGDDAANNLLPACRVYANEVTTSCYKIVRVARPLTEAAEEEETNEDS